MILPVEYREKAGSRNMELGKPLSLVLHSGEGWRKWMVTGTLVEGCGHFTSVWCSNFVYQNLKTFALNHIAQIIMFKKIGTVLYSSFKICLAGFPVTTRKPRKKRKRTFPLQDLYMLFSYFILLHFSPYPTEYHL